MSLKPAHIAQNPYLYPVGNTPAVCLTDTLPPEADARVLLLGCGDIRNILCTAYNDAGSDNRAIDFTCCDIEAEIIARNVVALTHIICDKEDAHNQHVWNIYYHVFIDPATMATLQAHVKDLLDAARSFDEWHRSKYSTFIRFCDEGTFTAVVRLWKLYATQLSSDPAFTNLQNLLKDQWKAAQRHQHNRVGHGVVLEGLRAAAPVLESHTDTIKIYRTFWSTGTCLDDKKVTSKFTIANPMFGCFRGGLLLHYGQSPLSGFHLAPVYTPMTDASPLTTKTAKEFWPTGSRPLHTAFEQFNAWCNALRKRASSLTVRFANADAIAFCHTLQHFQAFGGVDEAFWYRNPWSFERFILSKTDYSTQGSAPASFNIIDTSNLMDHLGSLNVLAAAASLLERGSPSTLRTEMMLPREANVAGSAEKLLCGNLPSVALLLGLKPIQYWTNATATWHLNEALLPDTPDDAQILNSMSRPIIMWKPADLSCVRYSATELARFLYGIYLEMHADESFAAKFSLLGLMKGDLLRKKLTEYDLYTRGSLTALLQCIKKSNTVDWQHFSRELIANLILNDRDLNMGPHHFQSLCAQLDSFGLIQMDQVFDWWHPRTFFDYLQGPFKAWKDIPPIVCITLVVPRNVVDMFSHIDKGNGTPLCQMEVQSSISQKQATYADIQMGFGQLHASGTAFTNQYNVKVNPDIEGWKSKSPLIVSTMVSTCSLVEYGDTAARIVFALKGSSSNAAAFTSRLGIFLHLHQSMVGAKDVFISRYRPNMSGHISVGSTTFPRTSQDGVANATITPSLTATRVASLHVRYDIESEDVKTAFQSAAPVAIEQAGLFELKLSIGSREKYLSVPFPLKTTIAKTRIARKQLRIEYTAPVADLQSLTVQPTAVFPVSLSQSKRLTALEHLTYVDADRLPTLRPGSARWLTIHTPCVATMSSSELKEYEKVRADDRLVMPGRLGVKETLHSMHAHIAGLHGLAKSDWFCLMSSSGVVCIILVDCIRMDLSHQTVFLDAALLQPQATSGIAYLGPLMSSLAHKLVCININDNEAEFWKYLLPTFAERCRRWKHKDTCEYRVAGRVPICTEADKPFVCSCGTGRFPEKFLSCNRPFKDVADRAIRVSIPVIFASPISTDGVGTVAVRPSSARPERFSPSTAEAKVTKPKAAGCSKCGAATTKAGNALLKCAKCKTAQYCSPDCQKKDWKKHKQACKQVQEKATGDDAA